MTIYNCSICGGAHESTESPCAQIITIGVDPETVERALEAREIYKFHRRGRRIHTRDNVHGRFFNGNVFHASPRNFGRKPRDPRRD